MGNEPRELHWVDRLDCGGFISINADLIRTSMYDEYLVSMKVTTHQDHINNRKSASGTDWSGRWASRVFMINTLCE